MNEFFNYLFEQAIQVNKLSYGKYQLELDSTSQVGKGHLIDLETNTFRWTLCREL